MSTPVHEINRTVHETISSYFLGPKAENIEYLKNNIADILDAHASARQKNFYPEDKVRLSSQACGLLLRAIHEGYFTSRY